MLRIVKIEELIQGATRPVLCRAENGEWYIVKGTGCAKQGLIAEWIANGDRQDSNPNMLWVAYQEKPWIIDHNLAFDPDVLPPSKAEDFWSYHLFRSSKSLWSEQFRNEMIVQMRDAVEKLNGVWESLPEDWTEAAELSAGITFAVVREWLIRFETQSAIFWGTP